MRLKMKLSILVLLLLIFPISNTILFADEPSCELLPYALKETQKIRGLSAKRKVPCRVYTKIEAKNHIEKIIDEELTEDRIKNEEFLFKALNLIPKDYDYGKQIIDLYLSQLGGFYDPKMELFAMASWIPSFMQVPVMVHELVHGLQDQHYNLDNFLDSKMFSTDQVLARSALVEGDATAVMLDYSRALAGQGAISQSKSVSSEIAQTVLGSNLSKEMLAAPEALRMILIFPYTSGLRYAHYLLKKEGYLGLNKHYKDPPISTKQILHPEKIVSNSEILKSIESIEDTILRENKNKIIHQDTLGEFMFALVLSSNDLPHAEASRLASSWKGDRAIVYQEESGELRLSWGLKLETNNQAEVVKEIFKNTNIKVEKKDKLLVLKY